MAEKLKGILLKVKVKAGENGKIFGGVTAKEISDELKKQYNFDIDKKKNRNKRYNKNIRNYYNKYKII